VTGNPDPSSLDNLFDIVVPPAGVVVAGDRRPSRSQLLSPR
jgi:hypothetical protein